MDVINFPQDITTLDPDQLTALEQQIQARGEELTEAENTPENVEELEALGQQLDQVLAETERRAGEQADLDGRKDNASSRFRKPEQGADSVASGEQLPGDQTDDDEDDETKIKAGGEGAPEPAVIDAIAASVGTAVTQALAAAGISAPTKGGVRGNVAALSARQNRSSKPREAGGDDAFMKATSHAPHMREGSPFENPLAVATAIADKRHSMTSVPGGTRDFVSIAHTDKFIDGEHLSQADAVDNFRILRDMQVGAKALVASGHPCAEYAPSYEFFRLAEPQNPVEQGTSVVQAPRGGINYIEIGRAHV